MTLNTAQRAAHYGWDDLPAEPLKGGTSRGIISGESHDDCAGAFQKRWQRASFFRRDRTG